MTQQDLVDLDAVAVVLSNDCGCANSVCDFFLQVLKRLLIKAGTSNGQTCGVRGAIFLTFISI